MEYDNTNRGVLFTNKKTKENQPDKTGQINIQGKIWELSGWNKTSSKGNEFISLSVREPTSGWDKTSAKGTEFTSLSVREPYVKETKASDTKDDIPW